jgi:photosystem II stability/assembly factor-like uncharacterized protein
MTKALQAAHHPPGMHRGRLQRLGSIGGAVAPILIVSGLLYAGFFVKPKAPEVSVKRPAIEKRDIFYGVAVPAPDTVWAAGNHGKIVRSGDRGKTWSQQTTNVSMNLQSIAAWDIARAVAVGDGGTVVVTADGGKTWSKASVPSNVAGAKLLRVRAYPGGQAWAVGEMGLALASSDFGATWRSTTAGEDVTWNDVSFVKDTGWLVGEFGRMQVTHDGGATWKAVDGLVKSSLNGIFFRNGSEGVAIGTEGVLLHTKDGGANWSALPKMVEQHLFDVLWDGSQWIVVGDKGALLTAPASDGKWSDRSGPANTAWHTQVAGNDGRYVMAGYGVTTLDTNQGNGSKAEGTK